MILVWRFLSPISKLPLGLICSLDCCISCQGWCRWRLGRGPTRWVPSAGMLPQFLLYRESKLPPLVYLLCLSPTTVPGAIQAPPMPSLPMFIPFRVPESPLASPFFRGQIRIIFRHGASLDNSEKRRVLIQLASQVWLLESWFSPILVMHGAGCVNSHKKPKGQNLWNAPVWFCLPAQSELHLGLWYSSPQKIG